MWEGDEPPIDGQTVLTERAESTPGDQCPSRVEGCPHKSTRRAARHEQKAATVGDLDQLKARLAALEAKVRP